MPDLETRPIAARAGDVGRDDAGVGLPGADQAGAVRADDARRALAPGRSVQNSAVSWTGTPSVMTTASGMPASIASTTAALVNAAGTKMTRDVGAGLRHRLGDGAEHGHAWCRSKSTVVPALRGLTPPTIVGAGREHPLGVLRALGAGHALDDDLGVFGEEDRHGVVVSLRARGSVAGGQLGGLAGGAVHGVPMSDAAGGCARRGSAGPRSTLLPSSRTTSGLVALVAEGRRARRRCRWPPRRRR